jgi:hypothetical protein
VLERIEEDGEHRALDQRSVCLDDGIAASHGFDAHVLGLDNRPQAKPHFRMHRSQANGASRSASAAAPTSFTPLQLAELYGFPEGGGNGQTIGIIELGGGYRPADLQAYFAGLGLPVPAVTSVSVDNAANSPTGTQNGPDGEVCLDIEVAGAIAPQANIVVYFAPNTDAGFLDAITTAVHDAVNKPSIISISWGGPESSRTRQAMTAFDPAWSEGYRSRDARERQARCRREGGSQDEYSGVDCGPDARGRAGSSSASRTRARQRTRNLKVT